MNTFARPVETKRLAFIPKISAATAQPKKVFFESDKLNSGVISEMICRPQSIFYKNAQQFFRNAIAAGKKLDLIDKVAMQQAIIQYNHALEECPDNFYVLGDLGFCYFLLKDFQKSLDYYSRAVEISPNHQLCQVYYNDMGTIYLETGDTALALRYYTNAIELMNQSSYASSKSTFAYKNRALLYSKLGRHKEALADINRALDLEPHGRYNRIYLRIKNEILQASREIHHC
ncbi:Photosystem I assembly protein Ycf3 [uncultured archaeon]|nr:Photosystem I assembly protein Ycf3 [uncultured archaeon]